MATTDYRILLVEDEPHMITTIEFLLADRYRLRSARCAEEAWGMLDEEWPDLLLLDLGLPDDSGAHVLREIRERDTVLDVVVVTGRKDVKTVVEVMKLGARDYIQKPFEKEDLLLCVQQAHEHWRLKGEVDRLRAELYGPFHFSNIIATSPEMKHVLTIAEKMCKSEATVLITGDSGTGKELVARAVHCEGTRRGGPFVAVNCAQFAGSLLESELFGHEEGSFTGATGLRKGRFELADGGTLFLDEVGNTSLEMQSKILRVVETRQLDRVGGQETLEVDIRLIAATNADLEDDVRNGRFREDLYYRLNVVRIEMPLLRDRKGDIPQLCEHFLKKHSEKTGRHFVGITPEAVAVLRDYDWRGNVRELQNVLEMAVALEEGDWITTRYFPPHVLASLGQLPTSASQPRSALQMVVENFERRFLTEQLRTNGWNHRRTAQGLGVHRNTIEYKIKKYGIGDEKPSLR